jgi:hypothetical protein
MSSIIALDLVIFDVFDHCLGLPDWQAFASSSLGRSLRILLVFEASFHPASWPKAAQSGLKALPRFFWGKASLFGLGLPDWQAQLSFSVKLCLGCGLQ